MERGRLPYKSLGDELLRIRKRLGESVAEVSGAVEISDDHLTAFERGENRPSEDILQLLISHFDLRDDESDKLWELAGYDRLPAVQTGGDEAFTQQPAIMILPVDARVVYSDSFQVTINQYGVVMNFMQKAGPNGQPLAVSRIGMSLEHAERIAEVLDQTIKTARQANKPKRLPASDDHKDKK